MDLEDAKMFLKVDGKEDDDLISSLILATKSYVENATGFNESMISDNKQMKELYNLTLKILLAHWYDNRTPEVIGMNVNKIRFSLDSLFLQLEAEYLKLKRGGITT